MTATESAGRGGLALAAGKLYFLVTGLVQQILLKQILGLSGYGAFSTASSIGSIWYNPLVQAGIQGVSRQTAAVEDPHPRFRWLLKFHTLASLGLSLVFFGSARALTHALGAPHVTQGVQVLSMVLFLYGLYAALVGFLNGRRRFLAQAGLDAFAATLRTVGLLVGAYVGVQMARGSGPQLAQEGVSTAMAGFAVAAFCVLVVAVRFSGLGAPGGPRWSSLGYAKIIVPIWAGQFLLNVLFQADGLLLRRFAASAAEHLHQGPAAADAYVGAYRASQLFCFLPFQLLTSITFVLFPLLAKAHAEEDPLGVRQLLERGLRIAILLAGAIVTVLVALPEGLLTLVFQAETARLAGSSMRVLAVGMGFFGLLGVTTSALNSMGAERRSLLLIALSVLLVVTLCLVFASERELAPALLTRVATATSLALILTSVLAALSLFKLTGAVPPVATLVRTLLAGGATAALVGMLLPAGNLVTLFGALLTVGLYMLLLVVMRELRASDWRQLRGLLRR